MKKFDHDCVSIKQLFENYYVLHIGQRRYAWDIELVSEFLKNLIKTFQMGEEEYLIGTSILVEQEDKSGCKEFAIVDSQQRITTLILIFTALKCRFEVISGSCYTPDEIIDILKSILVSTDIGKNRTVHKYRLTSSLNDHPILEKLILNEKIDDSDIKTISHENLINAYQCICNVLRSINDKDLYGFTYSLLNEVYILRIITTDKESAFSIFVNQNYQLQELSPVDLLKNILLAKYDEHLQQDKSKEWDIFINKLTPSKKNPLSKVSINPNNFLRHYIMSKGEYVTKEQVYRYFSANYKDENDVSDLLNDLNKQVDIYLEFLKGERNDIIKNINLLGLKQSYIVLLAANKVKKKGFFEEICLLLESVAFCYTIGDLRTNRLELYFTDIASKINDGSLNEAKELLKKLVKDNEDHVLQKLLTLSFTTTSQKVKAKYILVKIAKLLDGGDYSDYEIEHIMPQKKSTNWDNYKGNIWYDSDEDYEKLVSQIGNLALLTKSDNASIKDKNFKEKSETYTGKLRLTSLLVDDINTGTKNTKYDKLFLQFPCQKPNEWNKEAIENRSKWLVKLVKYIWFD